MDISGFAKIFGIILVDDRIISIGRHYYYVNDALKNERESIKRDVFSLGTYLGQDSGKHFDPSPACIDFLSKLPEANARKIVISEKSESLFLYGRNILINSISKNPHNIKEGFVFIQNEQDENLGYGIFQEQGNDIVVKNLLDKGNYLRDETKKKKR
jgi:ribosome biogenesis protein Nip4